MNVEAVVLTGRHVRLEPLTEAHADGLVEVGLHESLWRWTTTRVETPDDMRRYVATALEERAAGRSLPFATVDIASGRPIGSTRFGNIDVAHRRVEIGWTWITPAHQRTAANTEAKLLMLTHAFDVWGCHRVELKTDVRNERSRASIRRLGAVEEGILRHHMVVPGPRLRDTVYYSVLAGEWPAVRSRLEERLTR